MSYELCLEALAGFGERIRHLRMEREWTQAQFAQYLSVSDKAVSKWECGHGLPDLVSVLQISSLFHVSLDYLLWGESKANF